MNEDLRAMLNETPVYFWVCPLGHSDTTTFPSSRPETVHWTDGVAHCTYPGCRRTSTDVITDEWSNDNFDLTDDYPH